MSGYAARQSGDRWYRIPKEQLQSTRGLPIQLMKAKMKTLLIMFGRGNGGGSLRFMTKNEWTRE